MPAIPVPPKRRKGAILLFSAILMVVMMGMLAFSIDVGYMMTVRSEIQRACDSAALAGVGVLAEGEDLATAKAVEFLVRNPVGTRAKVQENMLSTKIDEFKAHYKDDFEINVGQWDPDQKDPLTGSMGRIVPADGPPSAVQVYFQYKDHPLFLGQFLGQDRFTVQANSVAVYQPRDIMVVLDLSGSMNDDTELNSIGILGRQTVEDNLRQCYTDLGSPVYGNGTFPLNPGWPVVPGIDPTTSSLPKIHLEYRYKEVYVTSTKALQNVVLLLSDGNEKKFSSLTAKTGTFSSGSSSKWVKKAWIKSGNNGGTGSTGKGELFDFSTDALTRTAVKKAYGWGNVTYPSKGSWDDYIDYCRASDNANSDAGYQNKYGYISLISYWLENRESSADTPNLWKASAQPVTAVKDSTEVFVDFVETGNTEDRIGLAVYNSSSGNGQLEQALTHNYVKIRDLTRKKQAGHYSSYTNIAGGMQKGRLELVNNARKGAFKLMVLMTDGVANYYNGSVNTTAAKNAVITEAKAAAAAKLKIVTISLGAGADVALMQQVADLTGGYHFNIPGGQDAEGYRAGLIEAFEDIASDRPLKIVK